MVAPVSCLPLSQRPCLPKDQVASLFEYEGCAMRCLAEAAAFVQFAQRVVNNARQLAPGCQVPSRPARVAAGLIARNAAWVYRSQAKTGPSHCHAYAPLYVIRKGCRCTVALGSVRQG